MKIALKIITKNVFEVYEVTDDSRLAAGTYKGAVATVRRLYAKDKGIASKDVIVEKSIFKGWY
jgi:hypothetical protein